MTPQGLCGGGDNTARGMELFLGGRKRGQNFCGPHNVTVAILAQGTHWAVAVTQALFVAGSNPARCTFLSKLLQALVGPGHHPPCAPHNNPNRGWFQLGWRERGMVFSKLDTLGFEPRAFRMRSGCDTTTPCALKKLIDSTCSPVATYS